MSVTILLVGCGNMGFALMRSWIEADTGLRVLVAEPSDALRARAADHGAIVAEKVADFEGEDVEFVVLAIKPNATVAVAADCAGFAKTGATFISVAAGVTLASIAAKMPEGTAVLRCMPNTPVSIGAGVMALVGNHRVSDDTRGRVVRLLSSSGAVVWLEDEAQMDAVTAISGSGPAYVFHFIEAMAAAGRSLGLPANIADQLALWTVSGAGALAAQSDVSPGKLRAQVTSPAGTTAAALDVLQATHGLTELITRAASAAHERSVELGKLA
jgi:pyrroline-5-carboxylate reductase